MDRAELDGKSEYVEAMVTRQLIITFAAIHTTTMAVTNILYNLAAMPEYVGPLREEIHAVKDAHGGHLNTRALQQLVKMDSYMKEIARNYPITLSESYVTLTITKD